MKKGKDKKMLKQRLRTHCRSGEIVSVYMDPEDPGLYQSGFILAVEGKHFLMAEVTDTGMYMGYTVFLTKEMYKLEYGGKSEAKEQVLYALRDQSHPQIETGGKSLALDLLDHAKQNRLVVTVAQYGEDDSYLHGFVRSARNGILELHLLDTYGERNGASVCKLDSITRIYCDGELERSIKQLHEYREKTVGSE